MRSPWLGLIELFVVLGFVLAYAAVELWILARDKRRKRDGGADDGDAGPA